MALDDRIDALYRLPLAEFTAARNALAKSLPKSDGGEDAKRIRALAKPTLVPWAVNQLFWHARLVYERVMKSGERLRAAQLGALSGRAQNQPAELTRAAAAHRDALAEAVRQATRLASVAGSKPDVDELSRTIESLSLAPTRPEHPGRLTEPVRPAGFEALAGVSGSLLGSGFSPPPASTDGERRRDSPKGRKPEGGTRTSGPRAGADAGALEETADAKRAEEAARAEAAAQRQREAEFAAQRQKAEAALNAAQQDFDRRKAAEAAAREALDYAERAREEAHGRLVAARKFLTSNF